MSVTSPTTAALRAAQAIVPASKGHSAQLDECAECHRIAEVIDRETGLPDLLWAARHARQTLGPCKLLDEAIAKVEGRP